MNYLLHMRTRTWIIILIIALIGLYGEYHYVSNTLSTATVPAETATSIATAFENSIIAVGTVVPVEKAAVGFKRSGIVISLPYALGAWVAQGAVIATLDTQTAQTDILKAKSDVLTAQAELVKSKTALINYESQKGTAINQVYAKAEDAVRKQIDPLFSDDETTPRLTFQTKDPQVENDIYPGRAAVGRSLIIWQASLASDDIPDAAKRLTDIRALLYLAQNALTAQASLDMTTLAAYKTAVIAGLEGINASLGTVNDLAQKLRLQEAEIRSHEARVASAEAGVAQTHARLEEAYLRAPFAGIITEKHTELGQFIAAGTPALSLAGSAFELQSDIPEAYIAMIRAHMPVSIMLDAYPEKIIKGTITSVEPAGRSINDVIYYRIKIGVNNETYSAILKNGLTANVTIKP